MKGGSSFEIDFSGAIQEPLGLAGFALFLVFLLLALGVRERQQRGLIRVFVVMAVACLAGGFAIAALRADQRVMEVDKARRWRGEQASSEALESPGKSVPSVPEVAARLFEKGPRSSGQETGAVNEGASDIAGTPTSASVDSPPSRSPAPSGEFRSRRQPKGANVSALPSPPFNLESLPSGAERPLALGLCGVREDFAFAPQAIAGELSSSGYTVASEYMRAGSERDGRLRELCRGSGHALAGANVPEGVAVLAGTLDDSLRDSGVDDGLVTSEVSLSFSLFSHRGEIKASDQISAVGAGFTGSQARSQSIEKLATKLRKVLAEHDH